MSLMETKIRWRAALVNSPTCSAMMVSDNGVQLETQDVQYRPRENVTACRRLVRHTEIDKRTSLEKPKNRRRKWYNIPNQSCH